MEWLKDNISKNRKHYHVIFDWDGNPKSYSAAVLLRNYYREHDIEFKEGDDWRYYFIVRRHFLRKRKRENNGKWICHYCGRPITKIQERNKIYQKNRWNMITVDHKVPLDKGGDLLSTSNMLECCVKCNSQKGVQPYEVFIKTKKYKKHEHVY